MASVERLYELYNIIDDAKADASKHEAEYKEILTGSASGPAERRLTSQFMAKFFHHFPDLQEVALNAQFDLCEDDDIAIRKQAIKDLPLFCKNKHDIIPKVADVLSQLLQGDDQTEISIIYTALFTLIKMDAKGTLTGIYYEIENNVTEQVRERLLKFMQSKIQLFVKDIFNAECEEVILKQSRVILSQVTSEEELVLIMEILKELKISKNLKGYQQLVDIIEEQCHFSRSLDIADMTSIHRLSSCLKQALPYFSSQIRSTKFFEYICKEVLPILSLIEEKDASFILNILRTTSELLPYVEAFENIEEKINIVFTQLLELMPLPPDDETTTESLESSVSLEFSRVECLLYIFHQLLKHHTEFLTENADRLKDFRLRLQYFARGSQAYQKKLRETLSNKKGDELKTVENRIKLIALKTTANINLLIKDLFHTPPNCKASIVLSWKEGSQSADKRHTPITFESSPTKVSKNERAIYAPPKDKFSRTVSQYVVRGRGRGGRGRGYGRGGFGGFSRRGYGRY